MARASGVVLRAATVADADAVAALCRRTRQIALPYLPDLHTYAEDCVYFRDVVFAGDEVHVAKRDGSLLGAIAFGNGWVSQLYVDPAAHGRGIGSALLRLAMDAQPELQLWTFQQNFAALRFYARHGFTVVHTTDGDNEEHEPDALLAWTRARAGIGEET
jgi:ribosomal protein S18 acetylase RimI-like enzyme